MIGGIDSHARHSNTYESGSTQHEYNRLRRPRIAQNRPDLHRDLKRSGELEAHLDEIAQSARDMHALIVKQLAERHPYDPVKRKSRSAWEGALERTAQELVLHDRVLVPDEETERAMRDGAYTD